MPKPKLSPLIDILKDFLRLTSPSDPALTIVRARAEAALAPSAVAPAKKLFTATDVAKLCEVDLKTIHNWADKGDIPHFRTPGRHLRFGRADVAVFLRKHGYPMPTELVALLPTQAAAPPVESTPSAA